MTPIEELREIQRELRNMPIKNLDVGVIASLLSDAIQLLVKAIEETRRHDDLIAALKMAREWVKSLHNEAAMFGEDATITSQGALAQIDAALAKAEGRS